VYSLKGVTRPVIGICTSLTLAHWGVWDQQAALLPFNYVTAVQRAGGLALMIAPDPELVDRPDEALDMIDGLMLAGGNDIDPSFYNGDRHPKTNGTVPERDRVEIALSRRAVERDLPVLGICRGMQLLDVALGGTLLQHLPDEVGHGKHRLNPGSFDGSDHDVRLDAGSLAARSAGEELHLTNSHHHQAIDELGEGLEITGHSTLDGLPEALEAPGARFVLGVQWHPEADETSKLIAALVAEAAERAAERESAPTT
jgi:putative glutamine amidotransferase